MTNDYNTEELIRRAVAAVKRYKDRDDWWDIRQEAVIGAIQAAERALKSGKCHWTLACTLGARYAVADYLYPRKYRKNPMPAVCSLDGLMEWKEWLEENTEWSRNYGPTVPDFSTGVIDKVALWQAVEQCASEPELDVARRCWLDGDTQEAVSKEMKVSKSLVSHHLMSLRRKMLAMEV